MDRSKLPNKAKQVGFSFHAADLLATFVNNVTSRNVRWFGMSAWTAAPKAAAARISSKDLNFISIMDKFILRTSH